MTAQSARSGGACQTPSRRAAGAYHSGVTDPTSPWPCIAQARARSVPRLPFFLAGRRVGSVASAVLPGLQALAPGVQVTTAGVHAPVAAADAGQATAWFTPLNLQLQARGWVRGWRNELLPVPDPAAPPEAPPLAVIERAAARFWGTLTWGAHANGYLADAQGRPTHLWLGRRSVTKPTDPGKLDNLVGGGVPLGQTPFETLVREGWEEAGLAPQVMQAARPGRVMRLARDVPEGLQFERLHAFDLRLPPGLVPLNQDGEVAGFCCVPVPEAVALAQAGEMTVDAALVTLDFCLRHRLLASDALAAQAQAAAGLWWEPPSIQTI